MMKHLVYAIMLLGMMFITDSCSDDVYLTPDTDESAKGEPITITIGLPENDNDNHQNQSRVAFNDETLKLTWQENDQVRILAFDANNNLKERILLNLSSGAGTTRAEFTGNWFKSEVGHYRYDVYYEPCFFSFEPNVAMDYSGQSQESNNNNDHLKKLLFLGKEGVSKEDILNGNFKLIPRNSVFRFDIKKYPFEKIGNLLKVVWYSDIDSSIDKKTTLNLDFGSNPSTEHGVVVYMAFNPDLMNLSPKQKISMALVGDKGTGVVYAVSESGKTYKPGYRYSATVTTDQQEKNVMNTWVELPEPNNNQILVTLSEGSVNSEIFPHQERIAGTNSFLISLADKQTITTLPEGTFMNKNNLLAVQLPESFTTIPNLCFNSCIHLACVKLPMSGALKTMGVRAFEYCTCLNYLKLPESLTEIGTQCFRVSGLRTVELPSSSTTLVDYMFRECKYLKTIHIPDNVTTIPKGLFFDCIGLKSVTGCAGVSTIGESAFYNCKDFVSYPFTDKLDSIKGSAFGNCYVFSTPIPLTVKHVGGSIIGGSAITEFTIHDNLTIIPSVFPQPPLREATKLTKLTITTAKDDAVDFLYDDVPFQNIDLYILKDWAQKDDYLKADVVNKTWNRKTWKSITLIDKEGNPVGK